MTRNSSDALIQLRAFAPTEDELGDVGWGRLFELIEQLETREQLQMAETELTRIFGAANPCSFPFAGLSRLMETAVSDEVVLAARNPLPWSRNGPGQAYFYWAQLGLICSKRPHLLDSLIALPIDRIFFYHNATTIDAVLEFATGDAWPAFRKECTPAGFKWLRTELPQHEKLIRQHLRECESRW